MAIVGVAIDDGIGDEGGRRRYLGEEELYGVGVFDPMATDVGCANTIGIAAGSTVDIEVGIGEILFGLGGRAGELGYLLIGVGSSCRTIDIALAPHELGVDFNIKSNRGDTRIVVEAGDTEIFGSVAILEVELMYKRVCGEAVGATGNSEKGAKMVDREVGDECVENKRAIGANTVGAPIGVAR